MIQRRSACSARRHENTDTMNVNTPQAGGTNSCAAGHANTPRKDSGIFIFVHLIFSYTTATPCPTPTHMVASPYRMLRFFIS